MVTITFDNKGRPIKKYPTIAPCGLNCGFCPRFYTDGKSRCPGCSGPGFYEKHPTCSFITCCVKQKKYEVCSECSDFPCSKFKSEKEYELIKGSNSYPSVKKILPNLNFIKQNGIKAFIKEQNKSMELLKTMILKFNDGRSKSYYCHIAELCDTEMIENCITKTKEMMDKEKIMENDNKKKAGILKSIIEESIRST